MKCQFFSLLSTLGFLLSFFLHRVVTQNTCTISCLNGGFCSNNVCYCPYPHVGDRCEKSKSELPEALIIEARITVIWIILIILGVFVLGGLCSILSVLIGNWLFKEEEDVQRKKNEEEVALFNQA